MPEQPFDDFGSLGPTAPEDHQATSDITGVMLKDLKDAGQIGNAVMPPSIAHSQELSSARLEGADAPTAQEAERVAIENLGPAPAAGRRPRTAAERINQLVRQNHEKDNTVNELRAQMAELRNLVSTLPQQFAARAAPQAAPAPAPQAQDPLGALLNGGAAQPPAPPALPVTPSLDALGVARVVTQVLNDRDQQQRAVIDQAASLRATHEESFARACEDLPALRDGRTQARQLFNQLFDRSPLKALPNGPEHVALQVRGLLADEPRRQPAPEARQQASLATPAAAPTVDIATGAQRSVVERELAKSYEEMRNGEAGVGLHKKITMLKTWLRENK